MKQELQDMIDDCTKEINDIEKRISTLSPIDKERKYLTSYALIKASGTLEFTYRSIVVDYFASLSNKKIDYYLDKTVLQGSNSVTYSNMKNLLGKFDETWAKNFKNEVDKRTDKDKLISSTTSLVNNRHSLAHGKSYSASFSDIKQYYLNVLNLIYIFDSVVC